jgi:hypothetical protein
MHIRKVVITAVAIVMAVTGAFLQPASPAAAAGVDVACTPGSTSQTFSPGITNTPTSTAFTTSTQYTPCVSTDPTLGSGVGGFGPVNLTLTCTAVATLTTNSVLNWSNGQSSTLHGTGGGLQSVVVGGITLAQYVKLTGTVTVGEFLGDTFELYLVYPGRQWDACSTGAGLTVLTGYEVLTITS